MNVCKYYVTQLHWQCTPALSPWERETIGGAGNGSLFREYPQFAQSYSLSCGERVRVRGNSMANCIDTA
jgi:hypothetical protein